MTTLLNECQDLRPSSARRIYDATTSSRYTTLCFNQKLVATMLQPTTTTSAQLPKSTAQTPDLEATLSHDEDPTESLTDLIDNSFTLLERLEEAAEPEERAETASIETTFYSIEYHANTSANAESASSISSPPSTPSSPSAPFAPSPSEPTQTIRCVSNEHPNAMDIDILIDLV